MIIHEMETGLVAKVSMRMSVVMAVAAGVMGMAALPQGALADANTEWKQKVATIILKNQDYPRTAQIRKQEGTAKVRLQISPSGEVASFDIQQSSGHEVLDAQVAKIVAKINPLPAPPSGETALIVPMSWRLD